LSDITMMEALPRQDSRVMPILKSGVQRNVDVAASKEARLIATSSPRAMNRSGLKAAPPSAIQVPIFLRLPPHGRAVWVLHLDPVRRPAGLVA
jgi:hypothetical protein